VLRLSTLFLFCWSVLLPTSALAQRFGGDFGGAVGFWLLYVDPGIEEDQSFGRDVGGVLGMGGRGFLQTGRVRLGGGGFGGSFSREGLNESGHKVEGGLSGGGFIAEYLLVQRNLELTVGGFAGGGVLTLEEFLPPEAGDVGDIERLRRRRQGIFIGYPWVRLGYNPAPLVNAGLQLGYLISSEDVGGFAASIDVLVGIIP
jgi:hypothetical protein